MKTILEAKKINKLVLHDLDVQIYNRDFTVVMGPSGAGKSTLLYALSCTDKLESGDILFDDEKISSAGEKQLSEIRAKKFGFVFQYANLISNLSLYENVLVAGFLDKKRPEKKLKEEAALLFEQMNLAEAKDRLPSMCSGGEVQRCAIARSVINKPEIIFADEPTGALNRQNSSEVLNLLSSLNNKGQTILMVTHDIRSAVRGGRILYIDDGAIVSELLLGPYQIENPDADEARNEKLTEWLKKLQW